jgi:hypothetical protein
MVGWLVGCRTHINTAKLGQHLLLLLQTITRHCWLCGNHFMYGMIPPPCWSVSVWDISLYGKLAAAKSTILKSQAAKLQVFWLGALFLEYDAGVISAA